MKTLKVATIVLLLINVFNIGALIYFFGKHPLMATFGILCGIAGIYLGLLTYKKFTAAERRTNAYKVNGENL